MADGYKITRSNYTIKKPHTKVTGGTVYERDFMTTNNLGGWDSNSIPHSENSFKMVYRDRKNSARNHYFGDYIETPDGGGSTKWTMKNGALKGKTDVTSESKILLNTNKNSLLAYAYYGSCTQLIQSTIKKIISLYPAEITVTNETLTIGGVDYYIVDNAYDIDIITKKLPFDEEQKVNPLRYFYLSSQRYQIYNGPENKGCVDKWEVKNLTNCYNLPGGGTLTNEKEITIAVTTPNTFAIKIYRFLLGNSAIYLTPKTQNGIDSLNFRIVPSQTDWNAFYENLDDFSKILLNKDSKPKYTAKFDYPHETERGIETYVKSFTWPLSSAYGSNLDIKSGAYANYVNDLLKLAAFYDENYTDNLWRMMAHDSVKNMDITFTRGTTDEDRDDYNYGTTKMEGLLWAYGRQFDEIKRYIDNIKNTNTVTYDSNDNIPDYFLTDVLNLSGWGINSAVSGLSRDVKVGGLYGGISKDYTSVDANLMFLKNLKINSKHIFSKKGTRYGIETILGLFGYFSDDIKGDGKGDYSISEYVRILSGFNGNIEDVEKYAACRDTIETDGEGSPLEGLPVNYFIYKDGEEFKEVLIPWYRKEEKMDGNIYFQMYGGWNEETINYLKIYAKISDLKEISNSELYKKNGDNVMYVYDISDFESYFPSVSETHYFVLHNGGDITIIGGTGWQPVAKENVSGITDILDDYRGNNPHVGYGNYDSGEEYFKYFKQIFKGAIDNENFGSEEAYTCNPEHKIKDEIKNMGWESGTDSDVADNKKVWYFYDKEIYDIGKFNLDIKPLQINKATQTYTELPIKYVDDGYPQAVDVTGKGNTSNTIYAEPSIMNTKKLTINFRNESEAEKKYIEISVIPYLQQMMPSTTILEIKYKEN